MAVGVASARTGCNEASESSSCFRRVGGEKSMVTLRSVATPLRARIWPRPCVGWTTHIPCGEKGDTPPAASYRCRMAPARWQRPPKRGLHVGQPIMYTFRSRTAPCGTDWEIRPATGGRKPATTGRSLKSCGFLLPDGHGKCPSLAPVLFELADTPAAVSQGDRPRRSSPMGSPIAQFPVAARDWPPGNVPGVGVGCVLARTRFGAATARRARRLPDASHPACV